MSLCKNCGEETENAFVCIHCGADVELEQEITSSTTNDSSVVLGIIGLSLITVPLATVIVSGIGLNTAIKSDNSKGKALNLIALIVKAAIIIIIAINEFQLFDKIFK